MKKGGPHKNSAPISIPSSAEESEAAPDDDVVSLPPPVEAPPSKRGRKAEPNGKKPTAARGKQKAGSRAKVAKEALDERMDIDEADANGEDEEDTKPSTIPAARKGARNSYPELTFCIGHGLLCIFAWRTYYSQHPQSRRLANCALYEL